jgi:hypothetical protein
MVIYLVWTGYEDVDAAFYKREDAEVWITKHIESNPRYGALPRTRDDYSIMDIEIQ